MPEYINNLSLLLGPFFIFTLHKTQSLNLFTDFSFCLSLSFHFAIGVIFVFHIQRSVQRFAVKKSHGRALCSPSSFGCIVISNPFGHDLIFLLKMTYVENSWTHPLPPHLIRMYYSHSGRFSSQGWSSNASILPMHKCQSHALTRKCHALRHEMSPLTKPPTMSSRAQGIISTPRI